MSDIVRSLSCLISLYETYNLHTIVNKTVINCTVVNNTVLNYISMLNNNQRCEREYKSRFLINELENIFPPTYLLENVQTFFEDE